MKKSKSEKIFLSVMTFFTAWFLTMAVVSTVYSPGVDGVRNTWNGKTGMTVGINNLNGSYDIQEDSSAFLVEGIILNRIDTTTLCRTSVHFGQVICKDTITNSRIKHAVDSTKNSINNIHITTYEQPNIFKRIVGCIFLLTTDPNKMEYMYAANTFSHDDESWHNKLKAYVNYKLIKSKAKK